MGARRRLCWRIVACASLVVACNDDDDVAETTPPDTAETTTTTPPVVVSTLPQTTTTGGPGDDVVAPDIESVPLCPRWPNELIAFSADQEAIRNAFARMEPPTPGGGRPSLDGVVELEGEVVRTGLSVYRTSNIDSLDASRLLAAQGISASPNYVVNLAPGIKYAPFDVPMPTDAGEAFLDDARTPTIGVLDTGYAELAPPGTSEFPQPQHLVDVDPGFGDVTAGVAAGHGTFIVNILAALLPEARLVAAAVEPNAARSELPGAAAVLDERMPDAMLDGTAGPVTVRGDDDVVLAISRKLSNLDYLNMSFGTYGCSAEPIPDDPAITFCTATFPAPLSENEHECADDKTDGRPTFDYREPLGLRVALAMLRQQSPEVLMFAAAGNDSVRDNPEFFPAAWAVRPDTDEFLFSIASDPKNGLRTDEATVETDPEPWDYSNSGPWVEFRTRGTFVVSLLPDTDAQKAGWYSWSGTSFATPCALALHVAERPLTKALEEDIAGCDNTLENP